jgi:hypothetical protein
MPSITVRRLPRIRVMTEAASGILALSPPTEPAVVLQMGVTGRPGPQGVPGIALAYRHDQTAPSASWVITHGLGRVPLVDVFLASGEQVEADVTCSSTTISVAFAAATTGFVTYI